MTVCASFDVFYAGRGGAPGLIYGGGRRRGSALTRRTAAFRNRDGGEEDFGAIQRRWQHLLVFKSC